MVMQSAMSALNPVITRVNDDLYPTTGYVANGGTTNDPSPTLRGILSAPLAPGEELQVLERKEITRRLGRDNQVVRLLALAQQQVAAGVLPLQPAVAAQRLASVRRLLEQQRAVREDDVELAGAEQNQGVVVDEIEAAERIDRRDARMAAHRLDHGG